MTNRPEKRSPTTEPKPRRARRFVLPDVHHDERTAERIEAFLDGPARTSRSGRSGKAAQPHDETSSPGARELDTRADWAAAFRHEASRHARYGRPASVLLLEIGRTPDARSLDGVARDLADIIRADARVSDRAVRMGPSSFRLLMPETNAKGARQVGERLERAFKSADAGTVLRPGIRFDIATPTRGNSLEGALMDAERRLAR